MTVVVIHGLLVHSAWVDGVGQSSALVGGVTGLQRSYRRRDGTGPHQERDTGVWGPPVLCPRPRAFRHQGLCSGLTSGRVCCRGHRKPQESEPDFLGPFGAHLVRTEILAVQLLCWGPWPFPVIWLNPETDWGGGFPTRGCDSAWVSESQTMSMFMQRAPRASFPASTPTGGAAPRTLSPGRWSCSAQPQPSD